MEYFDRPTRLAECPDGAADWVRLYAPELIAELPPEVAGPVLDRVNELAAPAAPPRVGLDGRLRTTPLRRRCLN